METYTLGTREMVSAMLRKLPTHYDMSLNVSDMGTLIVALAMRDGFIGDDDGFNIDDDAMSLLSGIAETLGVEGI